MRTESRAAQAHHWEGDEPDPRFTLANERTFLAWNRTAMALFVAGLAVAHFVSDAVARLLLELPLFGLGIAIGGISYQRWAASQRALRCGEPLPTGPLPLVLMIGTLVIGAGCAVIGVLGLAAE